MTEVLFARLDEVTASDAGLQAQITAEVAARIAADLTKQPLDATLTALAGVTTAADTLIFATGVDTFSTTALTAFARTLLDDVDAVTMRATLGSVIGTDVQAFDADLSALAANATNGFWTHTGAGTGAARTLTAPAAGFTITNPAGVAGDPTFVLANDLGALEGLAGTGIAVRSAADTWVQRSITAGTAIGVTNGDGVAGNISIAVNDAELTAIAGLTSAADALPYFTGSGTASTTTLTATARTLLDDASTSTMRTTLGLVIGTDVQAFDAQLFSALPVNSQSAAYTTVLTDGEKIILHPVADNNARTFTIAANASVAYAVGTAITFVNEINTVSIAINTDTLTLAGAGTTGTRTLAANGIATAVKIATTKWIISGVGLT